MTIDQKTDEAIDDVLAGYINKGEYIATDVMIQGKSETCYVTKEHVEAVERLRKVRRMRAEKVMWE